MGRVERSSPGAADLASRVPVRIVIADDHEKYRQLMALVVEMDGGAQVIGQASNGAEAAQEYERLRPDLLLMDVRMPGVGGIEACRLVRDADPRARILMLTMSDDEEDLYEAIKAGASGYLLKDMPAETVADAIRRVHDGHAIISPGLAATLMAEFGRLAAEAGPGEDPCVPLLVDREVQVLQLLARGQDVPGAAAHLGVSEHVVKEEVRSVLDKLHLHARAEAVAPARRHPLSLRDE